MTWGLLTTLSSLEDTDKLAFSESAVLVTAVASGNLASRAMLTAISAAESWSSGLEVCNSWLEAALSFCVSGPLGEFVYTSTTTTAMTNMFAVSIPSLAYRFSDLPNMRVRILCLKLLRGARVPLSKRSEAATLIELRIYYSLFSNLFFVKQAQSTDEKLCKNFYFIQNCNINFSR
jgi:hypothetical protein